MSIAIVNFSTQAVIFIVITSLFLLPAAAAVAGACLLAAVVWVLFHDPFHHVLFCSGWTSPDTKPQASTSLM